MINIRNAKQDIQELLSCFSEAFSRPSFSLFSSFVIGFIQLGKETHTSSMVQSLSFSFLHRSLSSFTRFLGQNVWAMEEVAETLVNKHVREALAERAARMEGVLMPLLEDVRRRHPDRLGCLHGKGLVAGIQVVVVTGDHPQTAATIARQAGLEADRIVTGEEVAGWDDARLADEVADLHVVARSTPEQKQQAEALKQQLAVKPDRQRIRRHSDCPGHPGSGRHRLHGQALPPRGHAEKGAGGPGWGEG